MSFLSFLGASRNVSPVFPAVASCSDTSARELYGEGREGRESSSWPWMRAGLLAAGCRAAAATTSSLPGPHPRPPLISSLSALHLQPWTGLQRNWWQSIPSRLRHTGLSPGPMSFLAPLLITPVSFYQPRQNLERERQGERQRWRRGCWNTTKWGAFFTCARRLGHMCSFWIRIWITGEFD